MKISNTKSIKHLVAILGLLAAPLALSAGSVERTYVDSYRGRSDIPVPLSVVMPDVESKHAGQVVEMLFVVTEKGRLEELSFRQPLDAELAEDLKDAVSRWRFAPARVDGVPVARKVLLPLKIVDGELTAVDAALAMK